MLNVFSHYYEITLEALICYKVMVCVSLMILLMASSLECSSPAHVLLIPPSWTRLTRLPSLVYVCLASPQK